MNSTSKTCLSFDAEVVFTSSSNESFPMNGYDF